MTKGMGKEEYYKGLSNFLFYLSHGTTNNETNYDRGRAKGENYLFLSECQSEFFHMQYQVN